MRHIKALAAALLLAACASVTDGPARASCESAQMIGRFDPTRDLFLAHFDIKTDVDDLHAAAAVRTMLAHPDFACVDYLAVAGAYGEQSGAYVEGGALFTLAFGENWRDAHRNRDAVVAEMADRIADTLRGGGRVWIMEGGQSNVSAAAIAAAKRRDSSLGFQAGVTVVQHSDWNEEATNAEALDFVQAEVNYVKLPDGNTVGNGSPGFRSTNTGLWLRAESDPQIGPVWSKARRLANEFNGVGYENDAVRQGGFDFSDAVEAAWIFGFEELRDAEAFFDAFLAD